MKIETRKVGTVDVVTPVGALVEDDAEQFSVALKERLNSADLRVVVSLQDVPYMDSTAIEGLLAATEQMADHAAALKLTNVSPTCREILELTGLSNRFRFFQDTRDAVKSFL
jgi:anti-anti-sigma factor